MTTLAPPADRVAEIAAADDLPRIHDAGVGIVRWRRDPPPGLAPWIDSLPADRLPNARFLAPVGAVEAALEAACDAAGLSAEPGRHLFLADIVLQAILFAHVERTDWLAVRLQAIHDAGCPRPHVDRVRSRLLCTYRGAGTEFGRMRNGRWMPEGALGRYEVGLFKGLEHPTWTRNCPAHRSPPADAKVPRLLLCLDRADAPVAATYH